MADLRIRFNEEMVGNGHPSKADTLNRLMLAEHDNEGKHSKMTDPWRDIRADGAVSGADVGANINTSIAASSNIFIPPGDWYLETPVLVDGKAVHFWLEYGAKLHVKNNTAGIKSQNAGAVLRISGDGQINGVAGYTGYGIHVTYGKLVISSLNFYQTNNWSIYMDRTTNPISYSQIGRLFLPDAYGIKIEGAGTGASVDSQWGSIKFTGDTRSELLYLKNATDINIGSITGGVNIASTPAIRMEQAKSISIADVFVTAFQHRGFDIDLNCRHILIGNAQDYFSVLPWYIDGTEIQVANMACIEPRAGSLETGANAGAIQIGNFASRAGSAVTGSPCVKVNSASTRLHIQSFRNNSVDDTYGFDLPAGNKVYIDGISLLSAVTQRFKSNILPFRINGGADSGSCMTANSGTHTADGNATVYTITHGLVPSIAPQVVHVVPESADAKGNFYISNVTSTSIEVTYGSATPAGTGNISLRWEARLTP